MIYYTFLENVHLYQIKTEIKSVEVTSRQSTDKNKHMFVIFTDKVTYLTIMALGIFLKLFVSFLS